MKNKYVFSLVLLVVILAAGAGFTALYRHGQKTTAGNESELNVVTSFYPMYVAAKNVIGDAGDVTLTNLSEPQTGCLHDYQLTTEDMKLLSTADVFIINGGGIEDFLEKVAEQYPELTIIDACEGLDLIEDNAHAWMSMALYRSQVENICEGLIAEDPGRSDIYQENTDEYIAEVQALEDEYADLAGELAGQPVILFHEAYEYLADEMGLDVAGEMDLDEERQVSAGEVADILATIETDDVPVILAEELYGKDMGDRMEAESDVAVVYIDPLTRGSYDDADSYLEGMRKNLELIKEAY
ncbi:MAG: metal ABC transporter substrate-binding protein [Clostridiales bacterium]|nr:metal ABC transporter substrate-binding protein [Clostridiales bacterium]